MTDNYINNLDQGSAGYAVMAYSPKSGTDGEIMFQYDSNGDGDLYPGITIEATTAPPSLWLKLEKNGQTNNFP